MPGNTDIRAGLIVRLGIVALQAATLDALLDAAVAIAAEGMDVRRAKVLQPHGDGLLVTHGLGWRPGVVGHTVLPRGPRSPPGAAFDAGHAVFIHDLRTTQDYDWSPLLREHGVLSLINVPIATGDGNWGVLETDAAEPRHFGTGDVDFLLALAHLLGVAVQRQHALARQAQAWDALTQSERAQRELAAKLEARVAQRTAERERALAALAQSRKLDALGHLTAGIAHDFNNVLNTLGFSVAVLEQAARPADRERGVELAKNALAQGTSMTRRLLAFARHAPMRTERFDVAEHIRAVAALAQMGCKAGTEIRVEHVGAVTVVADRGEFDTALLNLLVNARDAMTQSGTIHVYTEPADAQGLDPDRGYIAVVVRDEGHGIPADVLPRVFDPYFTTKPAGQGTGLGIPQVYGFAVQAGGDLRIDSRVGVGTTVRLILPLAPAE